MRDVWSIRYHWALSAPTTIVHLIRLIWWRSGNYFSCHEWYLFLVWYWRRWRMVSSLTRMMMTSDAYSHSPVPLAIPTLPKSIFNICTFKLIAMIITITTSIIITLWWLSANLACGQKSPSSQFLCRINRQRTEQWISLAALENNYHNVAAIAGVGTLVLHNSHISNTSCPLLLPLRSWWGRVSVLRLGCFKKLLLRGKKLLDKISHHPRNIR